MSLSNQGEKFVEKSLTYFDLVLNRLGFIVVAVILGAAFGSLVGPVVDYLTARTPEAARATRFFGLVPMWIVIGLFVWFASKRPLRLMQEIPEYARFALFCEGEELLGKTARFFAAFAASWAFGVPRMIFEIPNALGADIPPSAGPYVCIALALFFVVCSWRLLLPRNECS